MIIALVLASALADAPQHDRPGEYLRDRHWDVRHLDLDVRIDPEAGSITGTAIHTVTPLGRRSGWLQLDQVGLDIIRVTVDGEHVPNYRVGEETLRIPMPQEGMSHEVAVTYTATPVNGMHFRSPSRGDDSIEAFTQGEDDDNRFWYPGWDFPSDKFTVTIDITAPSDLTALAVGTLQGTKDAGGGWTEWGYALEQPITNYLVTVAVGEYTETEVTPDVFVYTPKGVSAEDARYSLGKVTDMIPWVEEWTGGIDHPYPLYRQVVVQHFLYGAMENPTLVTFHDRYVVGEDEPRPWRSENVVMHELAHQWFGNLVTTYGWADLWLNEGFATLLAYDWMAEKYGDAYAAQDAYGNRRSSLWDTRPMAALAHTRVGTSTHTDQYVQGATVLRWIRSYIGDDAFYAGVHQYLMRHSGEYVSSEDLRRSLEETGGRDLTWLFDQFVHGEGHPTLSTEWEHTEGTLTITASTDDDWDFPVDVVISDGETLHTRTIWLGVDGAQLTMDLDAPPAFVIVDPQALIPATIESTQPTDAWVAALGSDDPWLQMAALSQLDDESGGALVEPLAVLVGSDAHPELKAEALKVLGKLGTETATAALLGAMDDDHPAVREAAIDALGTVPTSDAVTEALLRAARYERDDRASASAMVALLTHDEDRAMALARTAVRRPESWGASLGAGILEDLGEERDLRHLLDRFEASESRWVRQSAMRAATAIAMRADDDDAREDVRDALAPLLHDRDIEIVTSAIRALGRVSDSGSVLRAYANDVEAPYLAQLARKSAEKSADLGSGTETPEPASGDEEDALKTLRDRLDDMSERLDRLERWR